MATRKSSKGAQGQAASLKLDELVDLYLNVSKSQKADAAQAVVAEAAMAEVMTIMADESEGPILQFNMDQWEAVLPLVLTSVDTVACW